MIRKIRFVTESQAKLFHYKVVIPEVAKRSVNPDWISYKKWISDVGSTEKMVVYKGIKLAKEF